MADPPRYPDSNSDTGDDTDVRPDRGSTASTPRWVKVFGIISIVVVLLFVILLFTRGPHRGPSRHMGSGGLDRHTAPAIVMEDYTPSGGLGGHDPSKWGYG